MNFRIISVSLSDEHFKNYREDQNLVSSSSTFVTRRWCSYPISISEILLGGQSVHEIKIYAIHTDVFNWSFPALYDKSYPSSEFYLYR